MAGRRRHGVAILGGTFDHLHRGHAALLAAAFARAERVRIGLTTAAFLRAHPKPWPDRIEPYATRRRRLARFLSAHWPARRWSIVALHDPWGASVEPGPDLLVVSDETRTALRAIRTERRRRGLPPLAVAVVPTVRAADGRPIASRRIRAGTIDRAGRRRARRKA